MVVGFIASLFVFVCAATANAQPVPSTGTALTVLHPAEGQHLPNLSETFVYGEVTPGSTLTINGMMIPVHPRGGYLAMAPVHEGPMVLSCEAKAPNGQVTRLERRFVVEEGFKPLPERPVVILKDTVNPPDDVELMPGETLRVVFQGSPHGKATFAILGLKHHIPMTEIGTGIPQLSTGTTALPAARGIYEGTYVIQPTDKASRATIEILLKHGARSVDVQAAGHITILDPSQVRVGMVTEDNVPVRTGSEGGYDLFLYKGMRVQILGKTGRERFIRLSSNQTGWVRESAVAELPRGTAPPISYLENITTVYSGSSTIVRVPLQSMLAYRTEEFANPASLTLTLFGAVAKTDLIRFDPKDPLIRHIRWRQTAPDVCQLMIDAKFQNWWGYDVRYEGTTLVIEIRKPWLRPTLQGMIIAVDAGHGGTEKGAIGPHGTMEKDANLQIAKRVFEHLRDMGAQPFLTREDDRQVPLYDRGIIAWARQARLFVSVHCNSSGEGENPLINNGFSVYFYHQHSQDLADSVHSAYVKNIPLSDHGLYYADFAVCRIRQMPAILTEQAFIIVPEQEILLFDPSFQERLALTIVQGIRNFAAHNYER